MPRIADRIEIGTVPLVVRAKPDAIRLSCVPVIIHAKTEAMELPTIEEQPQLYGFPK